MFNDLRVIFWKEGVEFRRQLGGNAGILAALALLAGVAFPAMMLAEHSVDVAGQTDWVRVGTALLYASMVSGTSFYEERVGGTLAILLATPLRPVSIFLGKWLWLSVLTVILMAAMLVGNTAVVVGYARGAGPDWSLVGFGLVLSGYVVAANVAAALVVPNPAVARAVGSASIVVPMLAGLAFNRGFGLSWDGQMLAALAGVCILASGVAVAAVVLAFRYDYTRR